MDSHRYSTSLLLACAFALIGSAAYAQVPSQVQWRYDYTKARKESEEKGRLLLVDFGTENCYWCRKLDEITFRDPAVISLMNERFIPLKVDAGREPKLTQALGINAFPTLVVAAPDGRILNTIEGFQDAARFNETLRKLLPSVARSPVRDERRARRAQELLGQARDFHKNGEYLLCLDRVEILLSTYGDTPEGQQAQAMMTQIKSNPDWMLGAADNLSDRLCLLYLNLAESLAKRGQSPQAMQYYERVIRLFPGTRHAESAQIRLQQLRGPATTAVEPKVQ